MAYLFDNYASFTNQIFGQLLSNYSRYADHLNMKAVSFFIHPVYRILYFKYNSLYCV